MYWEYYLMGIIILPGIIFSIWAQARVTNSYSKYSKVLGSKGITGAEVVRMMLGVNNINDVQIRAIEGDLSDNYNPRTKVVSLSRDVYYGSTISALGVAAHECGHAIQHANNYVPAKARGVLVTVSNVSSKLLWPIIIIGLLLDIGVETVYGKVVLWCGIIVFGLSMIFSLITLPVELDASKRALKSLVDLDVLDNMEVAGAKEVLTSAALTYVAALVVSILQLVRFLLIFARRRD